MDQIKFDQESFTKFSLIVVECSNNRILNFLVNNVEWNIREQVGVTSMSLGKESDTPDLGMCRTEGIAYPKSQGRPTLGLLCTCAVLKRRKGSLRLQVSL